MKTLLITPFISLLGFNSLAQNSSLDAVTKDYLNIKNTLVSSQPENTIKSAYGLLKTIEGPMDKEGIKVFESSKQEITHLAKEIIATEDIEKQRVAFGKLSLIIWEEVKSVDETNQTLYYMYCPMKKEYWISAEPAIKNPYYGSKMLTCGKVTDKIIK